MDSIPFFKVTLEEAKASLRDQAPPEAHAHSKTDWSAQRSASSPEQLSVASFKWIATLPANVRPHALARAYPRIANRLAEIWHRPVQCEKYLDDLVWDRRGNRQGFPPPIAAEIAALKAYFMSTSSTVNFDVWGTRIGGE